jgi:phosphate transport system protein
MHWLQRLGPEAQSLNEIHSKFLQMIADGRHIFDAASNALLGGTSPQVIRADLFETDRRINRTEQEIRRQIVVHGSIHGAATFPALLVMMSLVKDAERIGDYAKNIFDLTKVGIDLQAGPREGALIQLKDKVSKLLVRAHGLFEQQDTAKARDFLAEVAVLEDECDSAVEELLRSSGRNAASTVLTYRYFKRVISHIGNVVTSLVVPLDKLDYFDEPRESEEED